MKINITTAPAVPKPKLYTIAYVKEHEGIYQHTEFPSLYVITVVTIAQATSMTVNTRKSISTLDNTAAQNWNDVDPLWEKLDVTLDLSFLPASK